MNTPNLESGKPWSEWATADLQRSCEHGNTIETAAEFLCRSVAECADKAKAMGLRFREATP